MIADVLVSLGVRVIHIMDANTSQIRRLLPPAHLVRGVLSYRPEEVVLSSPTADFQASPRNVYRLHVTTVTPIGGLVRVGMDGEARLAATVTRSSAEELELRPGAEVKAHLKAAALRAFVAGR